MPTSSINDAGGMSLSGENAPPPLPGAKPVAGISSDCSHLFGQFKRYLKEAGHAGIVAATGNGNGPLPSPSSAGFAAFAAEIQGKLCGRIAGGYQASDSDLFLLLVPNLKYDEALFQQDLTMLRRCFAEHFGASRQGTFISFQQAETPVRIEGVFLQNRAGVKTNNALFHAFQELFGISQSASCHNEEERLAIGRLIGTESIVPHFQPIFSLGDGALHGYEALTRPTGEVLFPGPEQLFHAAGLYGYASTLDLLCRRKALQHASRLGLQGRLFMNVCPDILQNNDHVRGVTAGMLEEVGIARSRLTFEVTEKTLIHDVEAFRRLLGHYREQGYSIAIDDLGDGYAGLKMLARLEPEYVKLARFLVSGIDRSATQQALVAALTAFCRTIGAWVIAEGIERTEELEYLVSAGVTYGQGYLLARPAEEPASSPLDLEEMTGRGAARSSP